MKHDDPSSTGEGKDCATTAPTLAGPLSGYQEKIRTAISYERMFAVLNRGALDWTPYYGFGQLKGLTIANTFANYGGLVAGWRG